MGQKCFAWNIEYYTGCFSQDTTTLEAYNSFFIQVHEEHFGVRYNFLNSDPLNVRNVLIECHVMYDDDATLPLQSISLKYFPSCQDC